MTDKNNRNFFAIQAYRKRLSWLFFGLFTFVVFVHFLAIFLVVLLLTSLFESLDLSLWLTLSGLFVGLLVVGSCIRAKTLTNSGQTLALKMGGVRLFISHATGLSDEINQANTSDFANQQTVEFFSNFIKATSIYHLPSGYARLYEFCEQISIASGITMPMLYVLPHESGVNACVAGQGNDLVLVITQGAVDKLSNDQLYALIAHEFGHILHGDAGFNIRLSVMMAGLSLIYESAEWLESKLLGEFDSRYHRFDNTQNNGGFDWRHDFVLGHKSYHFKSAKDWLQAVNRPTLHARDIAQIGNEIGSGLYLSKGFLIVFLVIYRLIGVFGMASHEWLCQKFNHQRELLADATCVQLTRNYAIADLLKDMTHKFDAQLYSTQVSSFGFFFFADPNACDDRFFSSHPDYQQRIDAVYEHLFFDFGKQVSVDLDVKKLQSVRQKIKEHKPVVPIKDEIIQIDYFDKQLEQNFDKIVDGRLVVDKTFKEGFLGLDTPKKSVLMVNQNISTGEFNPKNLSWQITKNLRNPVGVLAVIECILFCQNISSLQINLDNTKITFNQLFHVNLECEIFLHSIDNELLMAVAKLFKNHRYSLAIHSLKVLKYRLDNPIHKDSKIDNTLSKYINELLKIISYPTDLNADIFNKISFANQSKNFIIANIVVAVVRMISDYTNMHNDKIHQTLTNYGYHASFNQKIYDVTVSLEDNIFTKVAWISLFLVSIQGEYFLLNQHDKILDLTTKALRLMDMQYQFDEDDVVFVQSLSMLDWLRILLSLKDVPILVIKTWQTILYYDGDFDDNERLIDVLITLNFKT